MYKSTAFEPFFFSHLTFSLLLDHSMYNMFFLTKFQFYSKELNK